MNIRLYSLIFLAVVLCWSGTAISKVFFFQNRNAPVAYDNIEDAIDTAKKNNKDIFIYFKANWCPACNKMQKETIADKAAQNAMSNYVACYIDVDKNKAITKDFGVTGIPAYFIIKADKTKVKNATGYKSVNDFINWLR